MPTDPTGSVVRNSIALRRFENDIVRDMMRIFVSTGNGLRDAILRFDPTEVSPGRVAGRIERLNGRAELLLAETYRDLSSLAEGQIIGMAEVESEFAARLLERTAAGVEVSISAAQPGRRFWRSILRTDPIEGAVMRDWWAGQKRATGFAFRRQVQLGLANSETADQIIRRVRGRFVRPGVYRGGVMQVSTRNAASLVRTAVNQIATQAQFETFRANSDITEQYQYVAVLDGRTSDICISLDGQVFRYDDPNAKRPPQHFKCRSAIVPIVDFESLGLDAPPPGMRAAAGGPVSADTDYSAWLRDQSKTEQDDILGPARARLFRSNRMSLRDLVRSDNTSFTLDELRQKVA